MPYNMPNGVEDRAATPLAAHSTPSTHDAPGCNTCIPVTTTCVAHVKRHVRPFGHATHQFGACPRAPRTKRNAGQPIPTCLPTLGGISRRGGRRHTNSYLVTRPRVPNMRPAHLDMSDPDPTAPRPSENHWHPSAAVPYAVACPHDRRVHPACPKACPHIWAHPLDRWTPARQCPGHPTPHAYHTSGLPSSSPTPAVFPFNPATIARRISPWGVRHASCWVLGKGGWHGGTCVCRGVAVGGPELAAAALVAQ